MSPRALLHRVRTGAAGVGDGLARALEGSWNALDPEEQRALAFVTVFRGGFGLEAAEAVIEARRPAIDLVSALRDKSLLVALPEQGGEVRLDMVRALRAHAERKLDEIPNGRALAESRHAAHFSAFAAANARARDVATRERLLAERENLLAVIERVARAGTVTARAAEPALRAMLALAPALFAHGPLRAFDVLVDPAIASTRDSGADPRLLAEVLLVRGALHRHRGGAARGARDLVQCLGIARTVGDAGLEARATFELAHALDETGDAAGAEDHLRRAAAAFAAAADRHDEGRALASLAVLLARTGRADEARERLARALALHEGDADARAGDLLALGALELAIGRVADARAATEQALALASERGEGRAAALARMQRGLVAARAGDRALARASLEQAAASFAALGFEALAATARGHLGALARGEGRIAEAESLLQEAEAALVALGRAAEAAPISEQLRALRAGGAGPAPSEDALVVAEGGAWFRAPRGERVGLERRRPLARIADRLAAERLERPGAALDSAALKDAAWPGEKLLATAAAHRVRVAISTLRKLGLPIATLEGGWALEPQVPIVRA
jgi:tetratricopeptide (TPR) repeat protein